MHDAVERDVELGRALTDIAGDPMDQPVDWMALRGRIAVLAEPELGRRRTARRRTRFVVPAALAAGVALFLVLSRPPSPPLAPDDATAGVTEELEGDALLDARVSDDEVRAMLSGAADADELLLIAAEERP